jgi:ribosomal protein S13
MDKHHLAADTLTILTLWLCDIYGTKGFYRCAEQIGQALRKYPDKDIITLIWLIPSCEDKFGRSFIGRFEKKALKSDGVRVLFDKWKQEDYEESYALKEPRTIRPEPTLDEVMLLAADGKRISLRKLSGIGRRISDESSSKLHLEIAKKIDESDDEDIKARLMTVFSECNYPYSVGKLISIYERSANDLKVHTLKALARFTDKRVHAIAVENLEHRVHIDESMGLLINNFDNDYDLVYNVQKSLTTVHDYENYHGITMLIRDIFKEKRDKNAIKILLHCYRNCQCSFCRNIIVETICKQKIIPDNILEECLYDCVLDTRKLAREYKRQL